MMGQIDPSPIPPWAVTIWDNGSNIFVALPMRAGGIPYIMKFDLTEAGLKAAMRIIKVQRQEEVQRPTMGQPANYTPPKNQPMVKLSKAQERVNSETTPEQRAAATDLLKRLGLVKP